MSSSMKIQYKNFQTYSRNLKYNFQSFYQPKNSKRRLKVSDHGSHLAQNIPKHYRAIQVFRSHQTTWI